MNEWLKSQMKYKFNFKYSNEWLKIFGGEKSSLPLIKIMAEYDVNTEHIKKVLAELEEKYKEDEELLKEIETIRTIIN